MSTGIVILNYNGAEDTKKCLRSIVEYNTAPVKYIVVDNGSTKEDDVKVISDFMSETFGESFTVLGDNDKDGSLSPASLIVSPTNDGYAEGNNKGLRFAFRDPEIEDVIILNNDVTFASDIIPVLKKYQSSLDNVGILTPILFNLDGSVELPCARRTPTNWEVIVPFLMFKRNYFGILSRMSSSQKILHVNPDFALRDYFPIDIPSGAFMFMDKNILKDEGGLDKGTFLYYEENILCRKLSSAGYRNYCIPLVKAIHIGGNTTGKSPNLFLQKCNLESADYYLRSFAGMSHPQRLVWSIVKALWKLKFRIKERGR